MTGILVIAIGKMQQTIEKIYVIGIMLIKVTMKKVNDKKY